MLALELLDGLLQLDLRGAQWVDLHELLQVEEGLRDRQLVRTARHCQEIFELGSVRKFENDFVNIP